MRPNRSMPACTVIPELAYADVATAATWLCDAFGFTLRLAIGDHRVQLNVGDGAVVLTRSADGAAPGDAVMVRVEDMDAHFERAKRGGARIASLPADYPYGERQYTALDLAGRRWTFSQSIADVSPESWGGAPGAVG
ncbi:VOC family protein [Bosea sp. 117]|uniref:VOC family protein n=1 Tax=Bosea sp. 117 TaxID=1125973 RepID=UPI000493BF5F|nr:VOC family protein [Bosea sp. 117]